MEVLVATDFFTTEVWTRFGLVTYYALFFLHLGSRRVHIAGITPNPHQRWIAQIVRNITDIDEGMLLESNCRCLIHDSDSKFCELSASLLRSANIIPVKLPPHSPNLNAYAERFILSATRPGSNLNAWIECFSSARDHLSMYSKSAPPTITWNVIIRASITISLFPFPPRPVKRQRRNNRASRTPGRAA